LRYRLEVDMDGPPGDLVIERASAKILVYP